MRAALCPGGRGIRPPVVRSTVDMGMSWDNTTAPSAEEMDRMRDDFEEKDADPGMIGEFRRMCDLVLVDTLSLS